MSNITLISLEEKHFTERYVAWHQAGHTTYYSASRRVFTKASLLEVYRKGLAVGNLFHYGIWHTKDSLLIGVIKIGPISWHHKTGDMATLIGDSNYLGKGLATEAIRQANQLAFKKHGLRKLFSGMYKDNAGSVKAYVKAGWVIEGILKHQHTHEGKEQDRILVACFNPALYTDEYAKKGLYSFESIYPPCS